MLDSLSNPLSFPPYRSVKGYENLGNWAVSKYYFYPWRFFYRHKIRMIERVLDRKKYESIMDFGSGPGIMYSQWKKHCEELYLIDQHHRQIPKVELAICSSVMEFVDLRPTFKMLAEHCEEIIIASPMKTALNSAYLWLSGDKNKRNSHQEILSEMTRYFSINYYDSWLGLYFCARGYRK